MIFEFRKLEEVKNINENIELNLFLVEYKINPANNDIVLKALSKLLIIFSGHPDFDQH